MFQFMKMRLMSYITRFIRRISAPLLVSRGRIGRFERAAARGRPAGFANGCARRDARSAHLNGGESAISRRVRLRLFLYHYNLLRLQ